MFIIACFCLLSFMIVLSLFAVLFLMSLASYLLIVDCENGKVPCALLYCTMLTDS